MRLCFALALAALLGACQSTARSSLDDVRSSVGGNVGKPSDTYGTNRRPDVYGGFTQPVLPTMGARGQ